VPWAATLKTTKCSDNSLLPGAWITDGSVTYYTDSNAQFIAIISDAYHTYIVNIGKSDYVTKSFAINKDEHEGKITTICLSAKPPSSGGGGGGGSGW
jgi:hypothetical protein